jgi:hypothetical protein
MAISGLVARRRKTVHPLFIIKAEFCNVGERVASLTLPRRLNRVSRDSKNLSQDSIMRIRTERRSRA